MRGFNIKIQILLIIGYFGTDNIVAEGLIFIMCSLIPGTVAFRRRIGVMVVIGFYPLPLGKRPRGGTPYDSVHNAIVLEQLAMMAYHTEALCCQSPAEAMPSTLLDKHFLRKHGSNAYYGQPTT